jgi:DNA-binding CsgD family transcriptional regulator
MSEGYQALTEKEKQTLRLLLAGHDAKSMARQLDLSVHTINERLRYARRKLSASSSREAARLLRAAEVPHPESIGDKPLGDAAADGEGQLGGEPDGGPRVARRRVWPIGGLAMLTLTVALLALATAPDAAPDRATPAAASIAVPSSPSVEAARAWLALVDEGKWQESWEGTTSSFQKLNTVQVWQSLSKQVRGPMGATLTRTAVSEEDVPAPPAGVRVIRFKTDYANKAGVTETISLARENGAWRVAGIYVE